MLHQISVIFVDESISDRHILLAGMESDAEVIIINSEEDGVSLITEKLSQKYLTIHIVSHGSPGCLYLGNTALNLDNIAQYASLLSTWQVENIVIYGCKVASGDAGTELIDKLHKLTGANIAASHTLTGNPDKGGNWELEVTRGELNPPRLFNTDAIANYPGVLENIFIVDTLEDEDDGVDAGGISLRDAINEGNVTEGLTTISFASSLRGETITLTNGVLEILDDVVIEGDITIDGDGNSGILLLDNGIPEPQIEVTIKGLVLTNSAETQAIANTENLILEDTTISNNPGGGISNIGNLEIKDSGIINNEGGGINNTGRLQINNSDIAQNTSREIGGIANSGRLTVRNSRIVNNSAVLASGGISNSGNATINNVIVEENSSSRFLTGGAAGGLGNSGTINITRSEFLNNERNICRQCYWKSLY